MNPDKKNVKSAEEMLKDLIRKRYQEAYELENIKPYTDRDFDNAHTLLIANLEPDERYFVIDGNYFIRDSYRDFWPFKIIRLKNRRNQLSYEKVSFYSDCLAFDNELIITIEPKFQDLKKQGINRFGQIKITKKEDLLQFRKMMHCMYDASLPYYPYIEEKVSSLIYESMKLPAITIDNCDFPNIEFGKWYKNVSKEIHIYASAIKCHDVLTQYLFFYRIIESFAKSNGKKWIKKHINLLPSYDFGELWVKRWRNKPPKSWKNTLDTKGYTAGFDPFLNVDVFKEWKRNTKKRIDLLNKNLTQDQIAKKLYNENRCGIAHGGAIVRSDISDSYAEVYKDLLLLKLLARYAILINSNRPKI